MSKPTSRPPSGTRAEVRVFTSAEYRADPASVIAHAAKEGTAVVADEGRTRMVVSIPTRDLPVSK
jgi:hypothetical protein